MKTIFYTAWDGTQNPFTLKRRDLIKAFMDKIMEGMDPTMAMAQMLWDGFSLAGMNFRVMGLKDILQHLAKKKEEFLSQYSLARIFDQPLDDLRTLLDHEAHTRTRTKGAKRSPRFEDLPPGLLEKIRSLDNFPFLNTESRHTFDEWKEREGDIRDLLEFYSTWSSPFRGTNYLDFDQALDLMRQMGALNEMEGRIRSGQWTEIDPQTLKELLGDEASRDFVLLLQLPGELLHQVWVNQQQVVPPLSAQQYKLLWMLYENQGQVISRSDLVATVWGEDQMAGVSDQALDALIRRLRDRIAALDPTHQYIDSVRGHGVRLDNPSVNG